MDTAEARRSQSYRSFKFYRNFYEEHKDDKRSEIKKPATMIKTQPLTEQSPVRWPSVNGSTVLDAWSGRRVIDWTCNSNDAKEL